MRYDRVEQLKWQGKLVWHGRVSVADLPDALPMFSREEMGDHALKLDQADAAFRADLKWYHLGYRCEVDGDAMKVVSFAYRVGTPIPRSEWKQRGLPAQ